MKENVILLQDINDLKKEYHILMLKLKSTKEATHKESEEITA
jgi:hypothetical protein